MLQLGVVDPCWGAGGLGSYEFCYGAWMNLTYPYVKNWGIHCRPTWGGIWSDGINYRATQASATVLDDQPSLWYSAVPMARFKVPARTICLGDSGCVPALGGFTRRRDSGLDPDNDGRWVEARSRAWRPSDEGNPWGYMRLPQTPHENVRPHFCTDPYDPVPGHHGGARFSYWDGHVKWHSIRSVITPPRMDPLCLYDDN